MATAAEGMNMTYRIFTPAPENTFQQAAKALIKDAKHNKHTINRVGWTPEGYAVDISTAHDRIVTIIKR